MAYRYLNIVIVISQCKLVLVIEAGTCCFLWISKCRYDGGIFVFIINRKIFTSMMTENFHKKESGFREYLTTSMSDMFALDLSKCTVT